MDKSIICPYCKSYEHCAYMGYADAIECKNFEKKDDLFDMKPLFEAVRKDNQVTAEIPNDIPDDKMNIPLYIYDANSVAYSKLHIEDLMSNTLQFDRCDRIIFRDRTLDFQFELPSEEYKNIDTIIVNGITFKKMVE